MNVRLVSVSLFFGLVLICFLLFCLIDDNFSSFCLGTKHKFASHSIEPFKVVSVTHNDTDLETISRYACIIILSTKAYNLDKQIALISFSCRRFSVGLLPVVRTTKFAIDLYCHLFASSAIFVLLMCVALKNGMKSFLHAYLQLKCSIWCKEFFILRNFLCAFRFVLFLFATVFLMRSRFFFFFYFIILSPDQRIIQLNWALDIMDDIFFLLLFSCAVCFALSQWRQNRTQLCYFRIKSTFRV